MQDADVDNPALISTLAAAAAHVGLATAGLDDTPLAVDQAASAFLGEFYGFAASVLEELRAGRGAAAEPSRVQLWPEHFDLAVELGSEAGGTRAAYGCSPGDDEHPEPYLYVAPWQAPPPGPLWQATAFNGAELPYSSLLTRCRCAGGRADLLRGTARRADRMRLELRPLAAGDEAELRRIRELPEVQRWWDALEDAFPWEEPEATRWTIVVDGAWPG